MSKGQKRSNCEAKKPKHSAALTPAVVSGPGAGERVPVREHNRAGARNGRR
jgi:hypothetical protein